MSVALSVGLLACTRQQPPRSPETNEERTSYAIGYHLGSRLRQMRAEVDAERIVSGFARGIALDAAVHADLDAGQIAAELAKLATATSALARASQEDTARRNEREGAGFLAANRARPGVIELPSGVQYRVVSDGDQAPPALGDRVTVEYEGRLLDGAVFDTSKDRFAPTIVRLARSPRAWREVLPLVRGGAAVEIWAPGHLEPTEHPVGLVSPGELVVFTLRVAAIDRHQDPNVARAPP